VHPLGIVVQRAARASAYTRGQRRLVGEAEGAVRLHHPVDHVVPHRAAKIMIYGCSTSEASLRPPSSRTTVSGQPQRAIGY
jgi:hypothetical protein